jgi:hypothetical protein
MGGIGVIDGGEAAINNPIPLLVKAVIQGYTRAK